MADNIEGVDESRSSNVAEVRKQVLTLVTRKFEGTIEKPIDNVVLKVLSKRRKKWRKRHHLSPKVGCQAPSPALREEKEQLTDRVYQSGERLLGCRRSSYALARQLEGDKRKLQLQVAESHLQRFASSTQQVSSDSSEPHPVQSPANYPILKDLQQVLSQVNALAKVRQMKLSMTPRLPPLDRRELPVGDTPNEQFGMSLLVPPQQVMQSAGGRDDGRVENGELEISPDSTQPLRDTFLSLVAPSDVDVSRSGGSHGEKEFQQVLKGDTEDSLVDSLPGTNRDEEHMDLDPAVELAPVNEIHDGQVCHSPDTLPRVACVMSFMEGQDMASVVEVMVDNDVVIETQSSLGSERGPAAAEQSSTEDLLDPDDALSLVPEKEEVVSTTPENLNETNNLATTLEHANHIATSPENLTDPSHMTSDAELVEMIMKDSQLAAWIAKARLRPRPPISYRDKRRKSRSRSSSRSVHD